MSAVIRCPNFSQLDLHRILDFQSAVVITTNFLLLDISKRIRPKSRSIVILHKLSFCCDGLLAPGKYHSWRTTPPPFFLLVAFWQNRNYPPLSSHKSNPSSVSQNIVDSYSALSWVTCEVVTIVEGIPWWGLPRHMLAKGALVYPSQGGRYRAEGCMALG